MTPPVQVRGNYHAHATCALPVYRLLLSQHSFALVNMSATLEAYLAFAKGMGLECREVKVPSYRHCCAKCNRIDVDYLAEVHQRYEVAVNASNASAGYVFYCSNTVFCEVALREAAAIDVYGQLWEYAAAVADTNIRGAVFVVQGIVTGVPLGDDYAFTSFKRFVRKSVDGDVGNKECCICSEICDGRRICVTCSCIICRQCFDHMHMSVQVNKTCPVCRSCFQRSLL